MAENKGVIYFNHGRESGPWGNKIQQLAKVAQARGYRVESPDHAGIMEPDERVRRLLAECKPEGTLVLVGSSMGGYVATVASEKLYPRGLFLMAPAFYIPDYPQQEPVPHADKIAIVHGWNDELLPPEGSIRYARKFKTVLHLVDGDHRLEGPLPIIVELFGVCLDQLEQES